MLACSVGDEHTVATLLRKIDGTTLGTRDSKVRGMRMRCCMWLKPCCTHLGKGYNAFQYAMCGEASYDPDIDLNSLVSLLIAKASQADFFHSTEV